jgi:hypothetical protein
MTTEERPLCRHFYPGRYAWNCDAGMKAPRDCTSCTRYDVERSAQIDARTDARRSDEQRETDSARFRQWKRINDRRPA